MKPFRLTTLFLITAGLTAIGATAQAEQAVYGQQWFITQKESAASFDCTQKDGKAVAGVIISETHDGDENADTTIGCATLKQGGDVLLLSGDKEKTWTITKDNESQGYRLTEDKKNIAEVACPKNSVLVARSHKGDENGPTTYTCQTLIDAWGKDMVPRQRHLMVGSQSSSDLKCPEPMAVVGRAHFGDENGQTYLECALFF
ncbi:hypothetical protein [Pseudomonas sp. DC3000-4b1]|uniref:hypothetical protein n=1 Tax=unclassified Pseudomonas TaxID=196821 RepID=UPI003CF515B7